MIQIDEATRIKKYESSNFHVRMAIDDARRADFRWKTRAIPVAPLILTIRSRCMEIKLHGRAIIRAVERERDHASQTRP